jgi:MarR family transcriptional regulator, organic hydroperoxide resistance regulator
MSAASAGEVRLLILAAQRQGSRLLTEGLRAATLTPAQFEVLEVLDQHAPLTLVELGRLLVCETGSPSRLVDSLVQRNLVAREPGQHDRRVVVLRLTPAGATTLADGRATMAAMESFVTERLATTERDQLARLLRKLLHDTPAGDAVAARYPE